MQPIIENVGRRFAAAQLNCGMIAFDRAGLKYEDLNIPQLIAGYDAAVQIFIAADAAVTALLVRLDRPVLTANDNSLGLRGLAALAVASEIRRTLVGWFSAQSAVEAACQSVPANLRHALTLPPSDDV